MLTAVKPPLVAECGEAESQLLLTAQVASNTDGGISDYSSENVECFSVNPRVYSYLKTVISWGVTPCVVLDRYQRFGGTCFVCLRRESRVRKRGKELGAQSNLYAPSSLGTRTLHRHLVT